METSSRKQSFSQALSIAIPEADGLTGTWARVPGAVVPFPEPHDTPPAVHPTAIVAKGAELGPGVVIGPFAYIGPRVRLGGGTHVGVHVILVGTITIGTPCQVHLEGVIV